MKSKAKSNIKIKNIIKHISIVLFTIVLLITTISLSFEYTDRLSQDYITENTFHYNDLFYTDTEIDNQTFVKLDNFVENLPLPLKNSIYNNKWIIVFSNDIPAELKSNTRVKVLDTETDNISGITLRLNRTVYIKAATSTEDVYESTIHEIGHIMDCEYGYISNSKEFYKLYKKYKDSLGSDKYFATHQSEFFAFSFSQYFLSSDELKAKAPDIYEYFSKQLSKNIPGQNFLEKTLTTPKRFIRFFIPNII